MATDKNKSVDELLAEYFAREQGREGRERNLKDIVTAKGVDYGMKTRKGQKPGKSGERDMKNKLNRLRKRMAKDKQLIDDYGEDAMMARGFLGHAEDTEKVKVPPIRPRPKPTPKRRTYNPQDPSEILVGSGRGERGMPPRPIPPGDKPDPIPPRPKPRPRPDPGNYPFKKGGKIKSYKKGGKVRGAGIAQRGTRKCKMR
jgi:hypothetical protein